jgi:hypothetical protein
MRISSQQCCSFGRPPIPRAGFAAERATPVGFVMGRMWYVLEKAEASLSFLMYALCFLVVLRAAPARSCAPTRAPTCRIWFVHKRWCCPAIFLGPVATAAAAAAAAIAR